MRQHLVSDATILAEAQRVADLLLEKWPAITTTITLETPSEADAYVLVMAPVDIEEDIRWEAAGLGWQVLSELGIDIVTMVAR